MATNAWRRQRKPRTANIGRRSDEGGTSASSPGHTTAPPGWAEKDAPMEALMNLEDDRLDDEIVFDSAEGSQEPEE